MIYVFNIPEGSGVWRMKMNVEGWPSYTAHFCGYFRLHCYKYVSSTFSVSLPIEKYQMRDTLPAKSLDKGGDRRYARSEQQTDFAFKGLFRAKVLLTRYN
jgi:hypothetical protein